MTALLGKILWVIAIAAWYLIRHPFQRRAKAVQVVSHARSRSERVGLTTATLGLGFIPGVYTFTNFPNWASYAAQLPLVLLGAAVYAFALWLFRTSHRDLGHNWSITLEVRERHQLVTRGVYRIVRHPMYSAFWLMAVGQALLLSNVVAGLAGLVGFGILYFLRIAEEERMMLNTFGEEYREYMKRTPRIIPRVFFWS